MNINDISQIALAIIALLQLALDFYNSIIRPKEKDRSSLQK